MVLGTVASVNATVVLEVDVPASTVTIVGSDFTEVTPFTNFLVFTGGVSATSISITPLYANTTVADVMATHAANLEILLGLSAGEVNNAYMIEFKDTAEPFDLPNGELLEATYSYSGVGWCYLLDQNGIWLNPPLYAPEPATLMLLGLGGLFFRRRK